MSEISERDLELALAALRAVAQDEREPQRYREWYSEAAKNLEFAQKVRKITAQVTREHDRIEDEARWVDRFCIQSRGPIDRDAVLEAFRNGDHDQLQQLWMNAGSITAGRSYEAAARAAREGDPDWRDLMPISWHISRSWDIYWLPLAVVALVLVGLAAVWMWALS